MLEWTWACPPSTLDKATRGLAGRICLGERFAARLIHRLPGVVWGALQPVFTGAWRNKHRIDATDLVFGTDATGTTNDPRTRVVAAAVVACTLEGGVLTEIGRITQVLPAGCNVVQGEAWALALLLRHTSGSAAVTADCKPAIAQAECATFRSSHANIWDDVWEERRRLQITWHPSHRTAEEYQQRYGDPRHCRVCLNDLADEACKAAAAALPWRQHAETVAQIDELTEEISHFLAHRTWVLLAGDEAAPLDCKPRNLPRKSWLKKPALKVQGTPPPPQRQNRPAPDGGLNKKQRLENLLATEHLHGHRFAWSHTNPNNHSLKCSVCTLYIQQVHTNEIFNRLKAQPCARRPRDDLSPFGFHATHAMYNMGAVLLCTKCFAVHKPGQLSLTKVLRESCEGASRAHKKKKTEWAQKYLEETTTPTDLFKTKGTRPQAEQHRLLSQTSTGAAEPKQATHPKPEAQPRRGEVASPAANSVPANLRDPGTAQPFSARPPKAQAKPKAKPKTGPKSQAKAAVVAKSSLAQAFAKAAGL